MVAIRNQKIRCGKINLYNKRSVNKVKIIIEYNASNQVQLIYYLPDNIIPTF